MSSRWIKVFFTSLSLVVLLFYTNCGTVLDPLKDRGLSSKSTEIGNAIAAQKVISQMCDVIKLAHPQLSQSDCEVGLTNTQLSSPLGVPDLVYEPFRTLVQAESAGAVTANLLALENCLLDIKNLNPNATQVQKAYQATIYDPFTEAHNMVPTAACALVFKNNKFTLPQPPQPPIGVTIVDFDFPMPATSAPYLRGLHGGIDFGFEWGWHAPYNAATTNHLYVDQSVAQPSFRFSGGAKILESLKVFTDEGRGTVVISDDQGQSISLLVQADLQLHEIRTGFTKASNVIFVTLPNADFGIGIDDITYRAPTEAQPLYFIQSNSEMITAPLNKISFYSGVQKDSFVIVQAVWYDDWELLSISDTQGNTFTPLPRATSSGGQNQQLWYFRPKSAGANEIRVRYRDDGKSNYNGVHIYEYGGVSIANPIGTFHTRLGTGLKMDSGNFSVASPGEMVFVAANSDVGPVTSWPGYTKRNLVIYALGADQFVRTSGTMNFSADRQDPELGWIIQVLTLR